jgi:DNA polymerase-3 subunit gamma/tau
VALALYRKYRSATFAEVIGQEHVTGPLMQALDSGRINHAYLFSGPRGCGKTSSARILARSLNCIQGPTPTPCGVCNSCKDLAPNGSGSIDVIEIDAASHGGVDDARDLRERAYYAPVRDRYKVYIIDEAHMVTTQGFNALLKLVEEPPDFLIFIFATTEPDKVLQTIRSRTHHYPFRLIPPSILRAHLERICAAEGATVEPTVFPLVVRSGGGSARDSLSILDQLLAGAGADGVTYSMAVGLLGVTDATLLDDLTDSLAVGDSAGVYSTIDHVIEAGHDPRRFAADLLDRFRDLMVIDAVPDAVTKGLIDYPGDQADRMADQSRRIGTASLVRFADITHTTLTDMRGTTSPRLMLELLCARMLLPDAASDSAALLQRIERLERRQGMGIGSETRPNEPSQPAREEPRVASRQPTAASAATAEPDRPAPRSEPELPKAPAAPKAKAPEPVEAAAVEPAEPATAAEPAAPESEATPLPVSSTDTSPADAVRLRSHWPQILDAVQSHSRAKRALMENATVASVEGTLITLAATSPGIGRRISDESNLSILREALGTVVGGGWQITVTVDASGPAAAPLPTAAEPDPEPAPPSAGRVAAQPAAQLGGGSKSKERPAPKPDDDGVDEDSDEVEGAGASGSDPETAAIRLLQSSLGARPLDG